MTTTGVVPGTREQVPSRCSRIAAGASIVLGALLLDALPSLAHAAFYVAVLATAAAGVALVTGYLLWTRVTLVVRTVALLSAGAVLTGGLLQLWLGLPGVRDLGTLTASDSLVLVASVVVLVLLTVDALRRKPEAPPDRPYAL